MPDLIAKTLTTAGIRIERVRRGRRLTHPGGAVVIETDADAAGHREMLVAQVEKLRAQIAAHDEMEAKIAKLPETVINGQY